jgi:hypothetical protein
MSLGANFSSGYTGNLQSASAMCVLPDRVIDTCNSCKTDTSGSQPVAKYPSMVLLGKICPSPTQEQFALYPKVAVPSSIRTQGIIDKVIDKSQRFSQYRRYTPPAPCPPLPPSMAGISKPSTRNCNL